MTRPGLAVRDAYLDYILPVDQPHDSGALAVSRPRCGSPRRR